MKPQAIRAAFKGLTHGEQRTLLRQLIIEHAYACGREGVTSVETFATHEEVGQAWREGRDHRGHPMDA
jgi:hypothetical protein